MPGRPRKPEAIRRFEGYRDSRPPRNNIPDPAPTQRMADIPPELKGDVVAEATWHNELPKLLEVKVFTPLDFIAFMRYCRLRSREEKLTKLIDDAGTEAYMYKDDYGKRHRTPHLISLERVEDECRKVEMDFGMNPTARTKIQVPVTGRQGKKGMAKFFPEE